MPADVTAKGESVANLADIGGTITGIMLSRTQLPMLPVFCLLSLGYLYASRKEVGSVRLPYLNRARLAFAARTYLATGVVPDPVMANANEPLLPRGPYGQVCQCFCLHPKARYPPPSTPPGPHLHRSLLPCQHLTASHMILGSTVLSFNLNLACQACAA